MALEPITRQEQIIVGKNLEPITRMERFLKEYGGGSGGGTQSDWNQTDSSAADFIKNKPFGDMPTGGDTLYWDGNTEGLVSTADMFYKVSDAVPTMDDLANGAVLGISDSEIFEIPADAIMDGTVDGYPCIMIGEVYVALEDEVNLDGLYFPQKGVYFVGADDAYISSFTIPGYTGFPVTKKMDEKYLPGAVILFADAENYLYATIDTSDTSKRMTTAELLNAVESGKSIYVYDKSSDGKVSYNQSLSFVALGDAGGIETMLGEFFAAEYTG